MVQTGNISNVLMPTLSFVAEKTGWMFYVVDPKTTVFEFEYEVPNYIQQVR